MHFLNPNTCPFLMNHLTVHITLHIKAICFHYCKCPDTQQILGVNIKQYLLSPCSILCLHLHASYYGKNDWFTCLQVFALHYDRRTPFGPVHVCMFFSVSLRSTQPAWLGVIVLQCCNNGSLGHYWKALLRNDNKVHCWTRSYKNGDRGHCWNIIII
jgi:hypothetical protein